MRTSLPSWLVAVCAAVVALALVGFVVTGDRDAEVSATPSTGDVSTPPADPGAGRQHGGPGGPGSEGAGNGNGDRGAGGRGDAGTPPVERRTAYVEVYNNSGISGLADETSAVLQDTGWRVVATDNWYGEIPADTVYFPQQLQAQARLLARDVGVARLHPAVAPMSFDRITVILTSAS